jgi:hypothetical protein
VVTVEVLEGFVEPGLITPYTVVIMVCGPIIEEDASRLVKMRLLKDSVHVGILVVLESKPVVQFTELQEGLMDEAKSIFILLLLEWRLVLLY